MVRPLLFVCVLLVLGAPRLVLAGPPPSAAPTTAGSSAPEVPLPELPKLAAGDYRARFTLYAKKFPSMKGTDIL